MVQFLKHGMRAHGTRGAGEGLIRCDESVTPKGNPMRSRAWMPSAATTVELGGDLIAVSHAAGPQAPACARPMRLEGVDALELYLVKIERNLSLLAEQIVMLQAALAERRRLLCMIAASRRESALRPQPMH